MPEPVPETPYARAYGRPAYARLRDRAHAAPRGERWRYWGGNVSVDRDTWDRVGPTTSPTAATAGRTPTGASGCTRPGSGSWWRPDWRPTITSRPPPRPAARCAYQAGSAKRRFEAKHGVRVDGPRGHDPWNLAVRAASGLLTESGIGRVGDVVDHLAERSPRWVAEKIVALSVEASALAGYRTSTQETPETLVTSRTPMTLRPVGVRGA